MAVSGTIRQEDTRKTVIASLYESNPVLAREVEEIISTTPYIFFIPGILGSGLKTNLYEDEKDEDKEVIVWGENQSENSDQIASYLLPCSKTPLEPFVLDEFKIFGGLANQEIYKSWLSILKQADKKFGIEYHPFAYDWRQNIYDSAVDFEAAIQKIGYENLKSRPIIFVAHSMGGLVLSSWLKNHYLPNIASNKLNIKNIAFLGTPHQGSAAMMKVLMCGYEKDCEQSFWSFLTNYEQHFVKALNMVGHTFPSVYQLLPSEDAKFINKNGRGYLPHFDYSTWEQYQFLEKAQESGLRCENESNLLEKAKIFRNEIDSFYKNGTKNGNVMPKATYFFGEERGSKKDSCDDRFGSVYVICNTPKYLTINNENKFGWENKVGDGRVLPDSARYPYILNPEVGYSHPLAHEVQSHGALLNNQGFTAKFHQEVRDSILIEDRKIADILISDTSNLLRETLLENDVSLSLPVSFGKRFDNPAEQIEYHKKNIQTASGQALLKYNLQLARKKLGVKSSPQLLFDQAFLAREDQTIEAISERKQIYQILIADTFADTPTKLKHESMISLGDISRTQNNILGAQQWMSIAHNYEISIGRNLLNLNSLEASGNTKNWILENSPIEFQKDLRVQAW
ncbi:MAG: hypothetical protein HON65_01245 [Rhodospirillales bacterium]|nr:hypothetical protein [Rhodospirillales bacterium]